jgi:hypothetical protein
MNRFNEYMSSNFRSGGCRLIARARDNCRNRDVTIHAMPGYWDVVASLMVSMHGWLPRPRACSSARLQATVPT